MRNSTPCPSRKEIACLIVRESQMQQHLVEYIKRRADYGIHHRAAKKENQHQADHSQRVIHAQRAVRQQMPDDVRAIERRQGNQVKCRQKQVQQNAEIEQNDQRRDDRAGGHQLLRGAAEHYQFLNHQVSSGGGFCDYGQQNQRDDRGQHVAQWSGEGGENVITHDFPEIARRDRGGFGPSEEEAMRKKEHGQRNEYCAQRVNMLYGIQGDAPQHARRRVAETRGHPGMGGLMQAQRKEQNNKFENLENNLLLTHATVLMVSGRAGWRDAFRKSVARSGIATCRFYATPVGINGALLRMTIQEGMAPTFVAPPAGWCCCSGAFRSLSGSPCLAGQARSGWRLLWSGS